MLLDENLDRNRNLKYKIRIFFFISIFYILFTLENKIVGVSLKIVLSKNERD
jgi:hypothetical protein